jgi:hypothetical protein
VTGPPLPQRHLGRLALTFAASALVWTLLVCYPNPTILFRNLARYHRLPIDPKLAARMHLAVPDKPVEIEQFAEGLLIPDSDWRLYRVPWYVPTPREAVEEMRGDCEAKALILASLLAGRKIPFTIRASFHHLWVDYEGRPARPGEAAGLAYLQGKGGRLGLALPRAVEWRDFLTVQRRLLWEEMPLFRRATWLVGLVWLALLIPARRVRLPRGDFASQWRPSRTGFVVRSLLVSSLLLLGLLSLPAGTQGLPRKWILADVFEAEGLCAVSGAFLVWLLSWHWLRRPLSVSVADGRVVARSLRGARPREHELAVVDIHHLLLDTSADPARPWRISAVGRDGRRRALLDYRWELTARQTLRALGAQAGLPLVVRVEGVETSFSVDEIGLPLRARQRAPRDPSPRPKALDLVLEAEQGRWTLRYPRLTRGVRWTLLSFVLLPAALFGVICWLLYEFTDSRLLWLAWALAGAFLSMITFVVIALRDEMIARLGEARVEIAEGQLRFHRPDRRVEALPLDTIETIELGRQGSAPTIAITSPDRLLHVPGLCTEEEREWVREVIEGAVVGAGVVAPTSVE